MRNLVFLFFLVNAISTAENPAAVVREWLPMRIGDRWIYDEEILDGNRKHPDVNRWKQEDTTVATQNIPEGLLVRRQVHFLENTAPPHYIARGSESNILVRKNCAYYLNGAAAGYACDSARNGLSGNFRKALASNEASSDVCFPLKIGQTWGNTSNYREFWTVAGFGRKNADDPLSVIATSWRLEAHLSSGDDNYVWFQKGIGVFAARNYHNGSYNDFRVRLVRFQPGASNR